MKKNVKPIETMRAYLDARGATPKSEYGTKDVAVPARRLKAGWYTAAELSKLLADLEQHVRFEKLLAGDDSEVAVILGGDK